MASHNVPALSVSIITPQGTLLDQAKVCMAVVPGIEGDLGVMARHTPLVTSLRDGEIKLFDENHGVVFLLTIEGGGVLSIMEEGVKILLSQFCPLTQKDFRIKGVSLMPQQLKIESMEVGPYKIDTNLISTLSPGDLKEKLITYLKTHPGTIVTQTLLETLSKKAAA